MNTVQSTCTRCPLHKTRRNVAGRLGQGLLAVIGEAPGQTEDQLGLPFVGPAGQVLNEALSKVGLNRSDISTFNTIGCRPRDNMYANAEDVGAPEACRTFFFEHLFDSGSWLVLLAGLVPLRIVQDTQAFAGRTVRPYNKRGEAWWWKGRLYLGIYHPSYVLRNGGINSDSAAARGFLQDLEYAKHLLRGDAQPPSGYDGDLSILGLLDENQEPIRRRSLPLLAYSSVLDENVLIVDRLDEAPDRGVPVFTARELAIFSNSRPSFDLEKLNEIATLKRTMKSEFVNFEEWPDE